MTTNTDWAGCIKDLMTLGMTQALIADAVGIGQQALSNIKSGRTKAPVGDAAVRLHALHRRHTRKAAKQ